MQISNDELTPADRALLDRFFTGECTPLEAEAVDALLARYPAERARIVAWREGAGLLDDLSLVEAPDAGVLYEDFQRRVFEGDAIGSAAKGVIRAARVDPENFVWRGRREMRFLGPRTIRVGSWIGAMALLIGVISVLTYTTHGRRADELHTYVTRSDQQAIVHLDDGTRMTLAPRTTVHIPQSGTRSRTVELESGEAYFEVAHASEAPFIVRSGIATTKVLGTAFLVRHDAGDPHVRVAVTDGKVRVMTAARPEGVTLTPGQAGDISDSTTQISTTDDLAPGVEWVSGRIMFRDTPLALVLQTVSQWYGYHFRYADQTLGKQSVTTMISTRSSAEALATIEHLLEVNLTVVGDTITLVPQPPASRHPTPRIRTYDVWTPKSEIGR